MCVAIPGQILKIQAGSPNRGTVDLVGVQTNVSFGLLEGESLEPGDWVLVYAGMALARIDEREARDALDFFREIDEAYEEAGYAPG